MRFAKLAVLLTAMLCLGACGQYSRIDEAGFTEVSFNAGTKAAGDFEEKSTPLPGGILIYIFSDSFATNVKLNDETGTAALRVPNGSYSFYAFGYSSGAFQGNTRCAVVGGANPIALTGTSTTIPIDLTASGCLDGAFIDTSLFNDGTSFNRLQVSHCGTAVPLTSVSGTTSCVTTSFSPVIGGYRLRAPTYVLRNGNFEILGSGLVGNCQLAATSGAFSNPGTPDRFPVGTAQGRSGVFAFEIDSYTATDCSSAIFATHRFHRGLIFGAHPDSGTLGKATADTSAQKTSIHLRQF